MDRADGYEAFIGMDRWLSAVAADTTPKSRAEKVAAENATKRIDAVIRNLRRPKWSARLPITGAANALANV